jgi:hypothetical protein
VGKSQDCGITEALELLHILRAIAVLITAQPKKKDG